MIDEEFFHQNFKKPLNKKLIELSAVNASIKDTQDCRRLASLVDEILDSNYFNCRVEDRRESYDCHARIRYRVGESSDLDFSSSLPLCLAPITNEKYFYCRGSLTEGTRSTYDEIIPSRDYACFSYEWRNLFSIEHAQSALQLISNKASVWASQEVRLHRIHLFGLLKDQQRSYTQLISGKALLDLFQNYTSFVEMCKNEGFEFFSVSFDERLSKMPKVTVLGEYKDPLIQAAEQASTSGEDHEQKRKKITYVIFVDSLDSTIFDNKEYMDKLPALKKIRRDSLSFRNFTSTGFWTYPCTHSLHTGMHPKITASFLKLDPQTVRGFTRKKYSFSQAGSIHDAISHAAYNMYGIKTQKLTSILREKRLKSVSIKSSSITSAYWNLLEGVDISIENSTIDLIPYHLKSLRDQFKSKLDLVFVDIDTIHRGPLFYKNCDFDWGVDELDFIHSKQSRSNRLLGILDSGYDTAAREFSQLKKVDEILGNILEQSSEQDTIILYSDNGSQNQPSTIKTELSFIKGSTGTIEKLWRPTLLVKTSKNKHIHQPQEELVSTTDLFSIILNECQISLEEFNSNPLIDANLPIALGGAKKRTVAESFGLNYIDNFSVEWCKRYGYTTGDYKAFDLRDMPIAPINEIIDSLESQFQA
ncbi:hypothetical protein [Synechococcus sp. HIMB2401]|uniref:hypothetical protein n=1 Tax=Synechococcus sp. HIMB2401 TaxID=3144208 RepID=UPI0036F2DAD0